MSVIGINEREHIVEVVNFFWGDNTIQPQRVNEAIAEVAYDALYEASQCTSSMNLVPRPTLSSAGIGFVLRELVRIGERIASGNTRIYDACKYQVARNFRREIDMAKLGL